MNLAPVLTREHLATLSCVIYLSQTCSGIAHSGTPRIRGPGRIPSETREHTLTSAAEQWRRREADFLKSPIHNVHNPDHSYTENIKQKLEVKRSLGKPYDEGGPKEKPNAEDVILELALQREDHHFKRSALTNTDVRDTGLFL